MNKTLSILLCTLTFLILSSCFTKDLPTKIVMESDSVKVYLSYMTTKSEMQGLKTDLKEKYNIDFSFDSCVFFDNNKLRILDISVKLPNGAGGKTNTDLMTIQNDYYGFNLDLSPNAPRPFQIGVMEKY